MSTLAPVDKVEIQVLVDNATDGLSMSKPSLPLQRAEVCEHHQVAVCVARSTVFRASSRFIAANYIILFFLTADRKTTLSSAIRHVSEPI